MTVTVSAGNRCEWDRKQFCMFVVTEEESIVVGIDGERSRLLIWETEYSAFIFRLDAGWRRYRCGRRARCVIRRDCTRVLRERGRGTNGETDKYEGGSA